MVRIRLSRSGTKKNPFYRVVVIDSRKPRDGRYLELIGTYNPRAKGEKAQINRERVRHWLACGAQPSDTVSRIFRHAKVV